MGRFQSDETESAARSSLFIDRIVHEKTYRKTADDGSIPMSISRRNLFQLSGWVIAGSSLAGCSYFEDPQDTSLIIQNHTPEQQYIAVAVIEPDEETRSPLFGERFELEGLNEDNSNYTQSFNQVFETQKAVVEVTTDKGTHQFTYYPTCSREDTDDTLTIRIQEDGSQIDWQAGCDGR